MQTNTRSNFANIQQQIQVRFKDFNCFFVLFFLIKSSSNGELAEDCSNLTDMNSLHVLCVSVQENTGRPGSSGLQTYGNKDWNKGIYCTLEYSGIAHGLMTQIKTVGSIVPHCHLGFVMAL